MKRFSCPRCGAELRFDSLQCGSCGADVSYEPLADVIGDLTERCDQRDTTERCNWRPAESQPRCASCALDIDHAPDWRRQPFQLAKRRMLRQLRQRGIVVAARGPALRFDLRASTSNQAVSTGHQGGLITLDTVEADPSERERLRVELGERYRTPLGHVRHEIGHWWWAVAIDREIDRDRFRRSFGDERLDYAAALEAHYGGQDDGSWRHTHLSHYAASHPWEDFAESFAHVLHIDDTLETAHHHGLLAAAGEPDDFDELYQEWVSFSLAMNEINRSMGTPDLYPFVVPPLAVEKIRFIFGTLPRGVE